VRIRQDAQDNIADKESIRTMDMQDVVSGRYNAETAVGPPRCRMILTNTKQTYYCRDVHGFEK
jgi:glucose-6-phosphate isomerase